LYCDEDASGTVQVPEILAERTTDGVTNIAADFVDCDFPRLSIVGTDGAGETVDVYYLVVIDLCRINLIFIFINI